MVASSLAPYKHLEARNPHIALELFQVQEVGPPLILVMQSLEPQAYALGFHIVIASEEKIGLFVALFLASFLQCEYTPAWCE